MKKIKDNVIYIRIESTVKENLLAVLREKNISISEYVRSLIKKETNNLILTKV